MDSMDQTKRLFLIGTIILVVLIVIGLVWAILAGPGTINVNGGITIDPNITFNDQGDPSQGPDSAKVVVRIYSDLQCPACKIAEQTVRGVIKDYQDRVKFVWKDFPLVTLHANSSPAALAARCAQDQGRFWQYEGALYDKQAEWSALPDVKAYFAQLASSLGLRQDYFTKCVSENQPGDKITKDINEGLSLSLDSTPTFVINRTLYSGVMDRKVWDTILQAQLK